MNCSVIRVPRALRNLFDHARFKGERISNGVAIAVSGGADSMALACLAKQHFQQNSHSSVKLLALIVDHGLRSGSSVEAQKVKGFVEGKIGIEAEILHAGDLKDKIRSSSTNLETEARSARYRLLGNTCLKHSINNLLVAHHEGDNYENILLRSAINEGALSLGLKPEQPIPLDNFEDRQTYGLISSGSPEHHSGTQEPITYGGMDGFEAGGVRVLRPLLRHTKKDLIEFLRLNSIPWIEDPSNSDLSITLRNVVRSLKQHDLPEALRHQSVLSAAALSEQRYHEYLVLARQCFNMCQIQFDPIIGRLYALLPSWGAVETQCADLGLVHPRLVIAFLLRLLADNVDPSATSAVRDFEPFISRIYPQSTDALHKDKHIRKDTFNWQAGSVQIKILPIKPELPWPDTTSEAAKSLHPDSLLVFDRTRPHTGFRRSKGSNFSTPPLSVADTDPDPDSAHQDKVSNEALHMQNGSASHDEATATEDNLQSFASHHFFDHRFWITIHNNSSSNVWLRLLRIGHLRKLTTQFTSGSIRYCDILGNPILDDHGDPATIQLLLGLRKDASLNAVIPVLTGKPPTWTARYGRKIEPQVLAFPTLGVRILATSRLVDKRGYKSPSLFEDVTWEVRHKSVDFCKHNLRDVLLAPAAPLTRHAWHYLLMGEKKALSNRQRSSLRYILKPGDDSLVSSIDVKPASQKQDLAAQAASEIRAGRDALLHKRRIAYLKRQEIVQRLVWSGPLPEVETMIQNDPAEIGYDVREEECFDEYDLNADPDHVIRGRPFLLADEETLDNAAFVLGKQYVNHGWWPSHVIRIVQTSEPTVSNAAEVDLIEGRKGLLTKLSSIIGYEPEITAASINNGDVHTASLKEIAVRKAKNKRRNYFARLEQARTPYQKSDWKDLIERGIFPRLSRSKTAINQNIRHLLGTTPQTPRADQGSAKASSPQSLDQYDPKKLDLKDLQDALLKRATLPVEFDTGLKSGQDDDELKTEQKSKKAASKAFDLDDLVDQFEKLDRAATAQRMSKKR